MDFYFLPLIIWVVYCFLCIPIAASSHPRTGIYTSPEFGNSARSRQVWTLEFPMCLNLPLSTATISKTFSVAPRAHPGFFQNCVLLGYIGSQNPENQLVQEDFLQHFVITVVTSIQRSLNVHYQMIFVALIGGL